MLNRPDAIIKNKNVKTCILHVAIPADTNVTQSSTWKQTIFFFSRPLLPTPVFPFQCRGL
jgi:hypothetical protein